MRQGTYVVLTPSGALDHSFSTGETGLTAAVLWAYSQAIVHRSYCTVAFLHDERFVPMVTVSHPDRGVQP